MIKTLGSECLGGTGQCANAIRALPQDSTLTAIAINVSRLSNEQVYVCAQRELGNLHCILLGLVL